MSTDAIFDRIRIAITRDGSIADFARRSGISDSTLRSYTKGKGTLPSLEIAAQIARAAGRSLDWIVNGDGDPNIKGAPASVAPDFALIPRLDVEVSAGGGAINHTEEATEMLAFRRDWLHRMKVSPDHAKAVTVRGDSMLPTLQSGDVLLLDTSVERIDDAGIYVVGMDDRVMVKRIQPKFGGALALIPENPIYAPEEIPADQVDRLRILGRVRWYGRSI